MKKNTKLARLRSLDSTQLAQVAGAANELIMANWRLYNLSSDWEDGTSWHEFFEAGAKAVSSCTCPG